MKNDALMHRGGIKGYPLHKGEPPPPPALAVDELHHEGDGDVATNHNMHELSMGCCRHGRWDITAYIYIINLSSIRYDRRNESPTQSVAETSRLEYCKRISALGSLGRLWECRRRIVWWIRAGRCVHITPGGGRGGGKGILDFTLQPWCVMFINPLGTDRML